ncbi:MAG: hypothetical protein NDI61_03620 [Bdellovibrionaceae bacterium]|nr:hypothetical protein [Pseudobdellovibrionaceae bacterium]
MFGLFQRGPRFNFTVLVACAVLLGLGLATWSSGASAGDRGGPWNDEADNDRQDSSGSGSGSGGTSGSGSGSGGGGSSTPTATGPSNAPACRATVYKVHRGTRIHDVKLPQDPEATQRGIACATYIPANAGYVMQGTLNFSCAKGAWALASSSCAEVMDSSGGTGGTDCGSRPDQCTTSPDGGGDGGGL